MNEEIEEKNNNFKNAKLNSQDIDSLIKKADNIKIGKKEKMDIIEENNVLGI